MSEAALQENSNQILSIVVPSELESNEVAITAYLSVFEEKLQKSQKRLTKLLQDRKNGSYDKLLMKATIQEAQKLKRHVKKMRSKVEGNIVPLTCPHCGEKLN